MKKITVILPIYEVKGRTSKCLDSILKQKDVEILCICYDDMVEEQVNELDYDNKIVVKKVNNLKGIFEFVNGEYVTVVNSDDYLLPNMYEKILQLNKTGDVDIIKTSFFELKECEEMDNLSNYLNHQNDSAKIIEEPFKIEDNPELLWGKSAMFSTLYRTEFIRSNAIELDDTLCEKYDDNVIYSFNTLALLKAKKILWDNNAYYCHYINDIRENNAMMDTADLESYKKGLIVLNKKFIGKDKILKVYYAQYLNIIRGLNSRYCNAIPASVSNKLREINDYIDIRVIEGCFNDDDQYLFLDIMSPLKQMKEKFPKILIYNWLPYDNPWSWGGGVTLYCKNIINEIIKQNPCIEIYFLSSGFTYDCTRLDTYIRPVNFDGDRRVHQMEIVNSPVPAEQRWMYVNPLVALENENLKKVFKEYLDMFGEFEAIHFNNIEGLSLDILDLKDEYPNTKFIYSIHNYVPLCVNGSYYMRHKHCNCTPDHTGEDCFQCTRADIRSNIAHETYMRGIHGEPVTDRVSEKFWIENFGFERLDKDVEPDHIKDFATVATQKINKNCDKVLAVSKRVYDIAKDNGFNESKMIVSYIGTKVADRQIGCASASNMEYPLKVVFLGSDLFYEEKGYPFLMDDLEKLEPKYARKIDLLLTVKQPEHAQMYRQLRNFHDVKIVNGYTHDDFDWIFDSAHLSIVPVLWEDNLPQIAIESVAYGVPVLASSAGGPSELTGSPKFKFECGNEEDFLNKLIHFVKNPDELKEYWNFHNGLVTLEEHIKELFKVYGLDKVNIDKMNFTIDMWKRLEKEYIFLKKKAEKPQAVYGTQQNGNNLQYISEISELTKQRDYLQYVIDETRKSKTYKIGRVITAIPRKIREKI